MRFEQLDDWLAWQQELNPNEIELGLARMQQVATALKLDQIAKRVVIVAGTNGKGSSVACLESLLIQQGLKIGAYTSPHMFKYNERVRIQGQALGDHAFVEAFAAIDAARGDTQLTFFEFGTLAALLLCQRAELDVAILEVGLGGRLDAVNIIDADLVIISSISLDHEDWLGSDVEQIGYEKAAVLRAGCHAVLAADLPATVGLTAEKLGCDIYRCGDDFGRGDNATWFSPKLNLDSVSWLPLPRESQALALMAAQLLAPLNAEQAQQALDNVELAGRFQRVYDNEIEVIFDVAHNQAACQHLLTNLQQLPPAQRTLAVFTSMQDKDCEAIIADCAKSFDAWFLVEFGDALPRAREARDIAQMLADNGTNMISVSKNPRQAYARAKSLVGPGARIVVFGSFYLVAPLLERALKSTAKAPKDE